MGVSKIKSRILCIAVTVTLIHVANAASFTPGKPNENYLEFLPKAEAILTRMPVIDGHNDFPTGLRINVFNDLRKVNVASDLTKVEPWASSNVSHTDLPRLKKGKVGGQFWVAFTECKNSSNRDSVPQTLESIDVIHRLAKEYPQDFQFAKSAADIEHAIANKRIASLIGVEGGHSIQASAGILRALYHFGARYLTLTHWCHISWADASPADYPPENAPAVHNGLSEFGLEIIDEMNRIGMMVDLSHVSVATMKAAIARSKAPVIFSHSNSKTVCDHHRNVPDDVLLSVKANQGIVMVNFYRGYVQCDAAKNGTIWDVVDHLTHMKNIMGADHVGIGGDYDGVPEIVQGLEDVSKYPNLIAALLSTGTWTEEELEKLTGRNILRVMKSVEKVRDSMKKAVPMQTTIKRADVEKAKLPTECISTPFIDDAGKA